LTTLEEEYHFVVIYMGCYPRTGSILDFVLFGVSVWVYPEFSANFGRILVSECWCSKRNRADCTSGVWSV